MLMKKQALHKYLSNAFPNLSAFCLLAALIGLISIVILPANESWALTPNEIIVVANSDVHESVSLALFYMKKRGIPHKNLVTISIPDNEHCNREDYEKKIALPVRDFLYKHDPKEVNFHCILTMYGVPLTIDDDGLSLKQKIKLTELVVKVRTLNEILKKLKKEEKNKYKSLTKEIEKTNQQILPLRMLDKTAAVDSELALIGEKTYPLARWVPNPFFLGYRGRLVKDMPHKALLIARLDGPSPEIVHRIIEDSLATEEKGLRGKAYFDTRWPDPGNKKLTAYAFYDRALHRTADIVRKSGVMPVVLDEKERLFQPGECPNAALYCGWYSLRKYVDAFTWVTGAVAYHVASAECVTLKKPASTVWCKVMLEKGVAATIGPVGEPYLQSFPQPELFFGLLIDGRLTLAECFALSSPYLSWKMILIGDPLYRPFKHVESVNKFNLPKK
ncbi:MAG: TIGR03790 family protein [Smithella sp.]